MGDMGPVSIHSILAPNTKPFGPKAEKLQGREILRGAIFLAILVSIAFMIIGFLDPQHL